MEKTYKTMVGAGAASLAIGIVILVTGIATGVIAIVQGAKLLKAKNEITF
ncbi:MAG: hypothetical protein PHN80_05965 [Hespellia sp.]|nr:hypothetical protein [Hespellia sp.]